MGPDLRTVLAIHRLPGYDGHRKRRLLEACRDTRDLSDAVDAYGMRSSARRRTPLPGADELLREADRQMRLLDSAAISARILGDPDYPAALAEISDPPLVLFVRGELGLSSRPAVAVVGTRRPRAACRRQAFALGLEFGFAGYPVVSGLAFGIDRSAHEGALSAGGPTWAALAGGLDRPSPRSHRQLARRILDGGGALLGEIPPGEFPAKYAFPRRNRILSGLCRGCIVVQAPEKSGALITANLALDQNRDLYVARSGLSGAGSGGTRSLEDQGAPIVDGAADVMADWGRFLDIRAVRTLTEPENGSELAQWMRKELDGTVFRHMGGWFEYRGA